MQSSSKPDLQSQFSSTQASVAFDLIRGLAALLVLLEHCRNLFFVDFPQIQRFRALLAIPYVLCGAGHQAVVLFFVLSGYFVGGSALRSLERGRWSWTGYLLQRLSRLWVVLIPALVLCLLWDRLGIYLGHAPLLYSDRVPNHLGLDVAPHLRPVVFFGNLFFVQGILAPTFGSNGALWSLANEFWYYLLFPLCLLALRRGRSIPQRAICALLFLACAIFVRGSILSEFPIWLLGAALTTLRTPRWSPERAVWIRRIAVTLYLFVFFGLAKVHLISDAAEDYLLAVLTFALLWILLSAKASAPKDTRTRLSRVLARFSFTLYAVHTPLLVFAAAMIAGDARWTPSFASVSIALGVLALVVAYAYAMAFYTEFRTDAVRQRVEPLFGIKPRPLLSSNPLKQA